MKKIKTILICLFTFTGLIIRNSFAGDPSWTCYQCDSNRKGCSAVVFDPAKLKKKWVFSLGEHVWEYNPGMSVWSASPVIGTVNGDPAVFTGAYDHNLYALEAVSGRKLWNFTTGGALNSAPYFIVLNGKPFVFVVSSDRSLYALDADSGKKVWSFETLPWSYTVYPCVTSSPVCAVIDGKNVLFFTVFNSDRKVLRNIQKGELIALEPETGKLIFRKTLCGTRLSSPTVGTVRDSIVFLSSYHGTVYALNPKNGDIIWQRPVGSKVVATPVFSRSGNRFMLFVGDFFGMVYGLDALTGEIIWRYKTGLIVNSTPALYPAKNKTILYAGAFDRCLHAIDTVAGKKVFIFQTGKYIASSPVVAFDVANRPLVFVASLGAKIYGVDGINGEKKWEYKTGKMLWPYETRASTLWSSPVVESIGGKPYLYFGGIDGKFYAFSE